jgi:hypothetical protein
MVAGKAAVPMMTRNANYERAAGESPFMKPQNRILLWTRWDQPARWVTMGFLVAVFFAPWGSAPRYAGWAISLVALLVMYWKGEFRGPALDRRIAWVLGALLLSGALTTAIMKQDARLWVKGFSLPVEFAFSIWLAAWVFSNEENGIILWLRGWYAGTVIFLFWGVLQLFKDPGGELLFSNINSLGLYICLVLPLLLGAAFREGERSFPIRAGEITMIAIGLSMLFMSFSISAWAVGGLQLILFFLLLPAARRILAGLAGLTLLGAIVFGSLSVSSSGSIVKELEREMAQLRTLTFIDPAESSSSTQARRDIAVVSTRLFKERPIFGWGWGRYVEESQRIAGLPGFENLVPEAFCGNGHSMFLNLMVRGGAVALLGVGMVHMLGIFRLFRRSRFEHEREFAVPAMVLIASIVLYSLGGDVFDFRYKAAVLFWSVLGLACMRGRDKGDKVGDEAARITP